MKQKIIVIVLIFLFSLSLRLWNLNLMGRTWDESAYVEVGYKFVQLIEKGDVGNNYFYQWTDEPPLARYIYGVFGTFDQKTEQGKIVFNYDYTFARFASALMSSLAVVLTVLIGWEFISFPVGIFAGIILSMLPVFLGLSQLATLDSPLLLTFTAASYAFMRFTKKQSLRNAGITGLLLGLAMLIKYTNILLIPLFVGIYAIWKLNNTQENLVHFLKKTLLIFFVSLLTFFAFWPAILFKFVPVMINTYQFRASLSRYPDIEVFFGRLMHLPVFYYLIMFLITTPLLIVFLFFLGAKYISDQSRRKAIPKKEQAGFIMRKWIFYTLIIWFCIPFVQSFYNFRHQGVRFIIEIYVPLSIIAAIGFDYLAGKVSKKTIYKFLLFIPIIVYLLITLIKISPYYLDYFNGVVGGTKNVYEKGLFQIGWWGQGLREAGYYLQNNVKPYSRVGLFISPPAVFPKIVNQKLIFIDPLKQYDPRQKYDYVVVNSFHVLRERFDDSQIRKDYKVIYEVKADGGILVWIYKHK